MSLRILKRDTPVWYAKNYGKLLRLLNRGRQIQRISEREGHFSGFSSIGGQFKILWMVRQLDKILTSLNKFLGSKRSTSSMIVGGNHLIMFLAQGLKKVLVRGWLVTTGSLLKNNFSKILIVMKKLWTSSYEVNQTYTMFNKCNI